MITFTKRANIHFNIFINIHVAGYIINTGNFIQHETTVINSFYTYILRDAKL